MLFLSNSRSPSEVRRSSFSSSSTCSMSPTYSGAQHCHCSRPKAIVWRAQTAGNRVASPREQDPIAALKHPGPHRAGLCIRVVGVDGVPVDGEHAGQAELGPGQRAAIAAPAVARTGPA